MGAEEGKEAMSRKKTRKEGEQWKQNEGRKRKQSGKCNGKKSWQAVVES